MSTILDALRKAKEHPPKDVVDAGREVLSDHTHDYLATVTPSAGRQVLVLKIVVGICLLLILALGAVVAGLMVGNRPVPPTESVEPVAAPSNTADPVHVVSAERVMQVKIQRPLTVKIPTAVPEVPTPVPQPVAVAPTAVPPAPTVAPKPTATPAATPAVQAATVNKELQGMRVEGIVWDPRSPMAMVNGQLLKQGSRIGPAEVVRIERDAVVLRVDGREYVLGH